VLANGESGAAAISAWGADHRRITLDFSTPGRAHTYTAESDARSAA